jgi:hypothetical protein
MAWVDNNILEQRLLLRESAFSISNIGKIATKVQHVFNSMKVKDETIIKDENETKMNVIADNNNVKDDKKKNEDIVVESAVDLLIKEVLMYKLLMSKTGQVFNTSESEIEAYNLLEKDIEEQLLIAELDIKNLEEELKQEQQIRQHRIECDELAKDVGTLPTRIFLETQINSVNNHISNTKESLISIDNQIQTRSKQFDSLMAAISILEKNLDDDDSISPVPMDEDDDIVDDDNEDRERRDEIEEVKEVKKVVDDDDDDDDEEEEKKNKEEEENKD